MMPDGNANSASTPEVVAGLVHKKEIIIKDWEIDKYTYLRCDFTAQLNIHDEPFLQK